MPTRCGRVIHDSGFCFYPRSDHCPAHRTGGNADTRMAADTFHLPRVRQGVDIQDALLFSKPDGSLDGCPIPFETFQVQILLTRKGREVVIMHGNAFMLHGERRGACHAEDDAKACAAQGQAPTSHTVIDLSLEEVYKVSLMVPGEGCA